MQQRIKHLLLSALAILLADFAFAQPDAQPAGVFIDFKLPTPVQNKSFRYLVDGIGDFSLSWQRPFAGSLVLGAGASYTYFTVDGRQSPELTDGVINQAGAFVRLGYQPYLSDRIFANFGLQGGYSIMTLKSDVCAQAHQLGDETVAAPLIEPSAGLFLLSQDNMAFGLILSYRFTSSEFDPAVLCLDRLNHVITDSDKSGAYQTFSIGFSAVVFVGKNRPVTSR